MTVTTSPSRTRSTVMWIGIIFSAVAVALLLWRVNFGDLGAALAAANLVWLAPSLGLFLLMFVLRAWRWSLLLGGTPFAATWHANLIGYMFNVTLPLRLGEIARAYVIARNGNVSMARALSAVVVDRLIDLAAVLLLFAGFTLRIPMGPTFSRAAAIGSVAVIAALTVAVLLVAKGPAVERILRARLKHHGQDRVDRWLGRFHDIREGFRAVGSPKRLAACLVATALIWVVTILIAVTCLEAFLPSQSGLDPAGLVVVTANLGGALPSAPGGLGIVQGFATSALVIPFGVPESKALAFVLVWSLGQQLLLVLLGMVSLGRVGLSFSEIRAAGSQGG